MAHGLHGLYERWLNDLWNRQTTHVRDLIADDFIGHWPDKTVRGPDALAGIIRETHEILDDMSFKIEVSPVVEGDYVAARWVGAGTAGRETVRFAGNDLLRIRGRLLSTGSRRCRCPDVSGLDGRRAGPQGSQQTQSLPERRALRLDD